MVEWNKMNIPGIANIQKCVGEFNVWELQKTPYAKFKVKVFEGSKGEFTGYTNLLIKDKDGCPYPGVGHGSSLDESLFNTIQSFMKTLDGKKEWSEEDFECSDPYDF